MQQMQIQGTEIQIKEYQGKRVDKLETETVPEFYNYSDFADCVLDIFQEVQGKVEAEVDWAAKDFNPITINEVFDC